jgi:hypothetical protein
VNTTVVLRVPDSLLGNIVTKSCDISIDDGLGGSQGYVGTSAPNDFEIADLEPGRMFTIHTMCVTTGHRNVSSVSFARTRMELPPDALPQAFMATRREVFVHLPTISTAGKRFQQHEIFMDNGLRGSLLPEWSGDGMQTAYTAEWLYPGRNYHFRVVSLDVEGQGFLNEFYAQTIPEPEPAESPSIASKGSTNITVALPRFNAFGSRVERYAIRKCDGWVSRGRSSEILFNVSFTFFFFFDGLF